jgi:hypothetical protein
MARRRSRLRAVVFKSVRISAWRANDGPVFAVLSSLLVSVGCLGQSKKPHVVSVDTHQRNFDTIICGGCGAACSNLANGHMAASHKQFQDCADVEPTISRFGFWATQIPNGIYRRSVLERGLVEFSACWRCKAWIYRSLARVYANEGLASSSEWGYETPSAEDALGLSCSMLIISGCYDAELRDDPCELTERGHSSKTVWQANAKTNPSSCK